MKWNVSDVIAITAIIASAVGPVVNNIFNYFKTIHQEELETQVLMYADNNLAEKIKLFNEIDSRYIYNKVPDEFLEVLRAFNVQWQTQLPKLNLKHNK